MIWISESNLKALEEGEAHWCPTCNVIKGTEQPPFSMRGFDFCCDGTVMMSKQDVDSLIKMGSVRVKCDTGIMCPRES